MTATEYAKQFENYPTYHKIAVDAFNCGMKNAKKPNIEKLESDLKKTKQELKELWETLQDPEKCSELISGL
jgi:S-adenosylmethionine/arginine decarboxylase-like enzyme